MNNAIKYAICTGASLALGFGAGYFFKGAQDNVGAMEKQAKFEASAVSYASENFKQVNSDLYSAHQSVNNIENSLKEMSKSLEGMRGNYEGGPGTPGDPGIGDLFPGPGKIKDEPGSGKAEGLDDLFKDKEGEKK